MEASRGVKGLERGRGGGGGGLECNMVMMDGTRGGEGPAEDALDTKPDRWHPHPPSKSASAPGRPIRFVRSCVFVQSDSFVRVYSLGLKRRFN